MLAGVPGPKLGLADSSINVTTITSSVFAAVGAGPFANTVGTRNGNAVPAIQLSYIPVIAGTCD